MLFLNVLRTHHTRVVYEQLGHGWNRIRTVPRVPRHICVLRVVREVRARAEWRSAYHSCNLLILIYGSLRSLHLIHFNRISGCSICSPASCHRAAGPRSPDEPHESAPPRRPSWPCCRRPPSRPDGLATSCDKSNLTHPSSFT
jgi:hypothetical protein